MNFRDNSISHFGEFTQYMVGVIGIEAAKQTAMWGTFGKDALEHCKGTCPEHQLRYKRLLDCDTEHLQAILRTQSLNQSYLDIINSILKDRGVNAAKR